MNKGGIPVEYKLVRNEKYYEKKAYLNAINFHFYESEDLLANDLIYGNIDTASDLSNESVKKIKKSGVDIVFKESITPRVFGIFINTSQSELLSDLDTRMAISLVVDRDSIINEVFGGDAIAIDGPLPRQYQKASSTQNINLASKILEKDGWKKNDSGIYEKKIKNILTELSFSLYTSDNPEFKKVAELISKQLLASGIKVNVKIFDENELYNNVIRTRKFDTLLFGQHVGRSEDLYAFWHSSQRIAPGLNISMYVNNKADKILESIRNENVEEKKIKLYNDLESIISSDIPAIFLYSPKYIYAIPKDLQGLEIIKLTVPSERFYNINSWYTKTERVLKLFNQN
jgi:peptide/nickel transport system substrate-binding protein